MYQHKNPKFGSHKAERKISQKATTKCSAHSFEKTENCFSAKTWPLSVAKQEWK